MIRTFTGHSSRVASVAFSPDGRQALSGSWDKTLKLWDVATGEEARAFKGHSDYVFSAAFSPNGCMALSVSVDKTIRLWNVVTGKENARMFSFDNDGWICMTPEGYYTASKNAEQFIRLRKGNEIYGIEKYRSIYYKPDIVRKALSAINNVSN